MKYYLTSNSKCLDIWRDDETNTNYCRHVKRFRGRSKENGGTVERLTKGSWWISEHTIAESEDIEELTGLAALESIVEPKRRWRFIWRKK